MTAMKNVKINIITVISQIQIKDMCKMGELMHW